MKDSHIRSVTKGITWRVTGTLDTIMLSYIFTGVVGDALYIGFSELFTKVPLFYIHERIWMRMPFGRKNVMQPDGSILLVDAHWRSLVKGISWRCFGTMDTILLALFWTGDFSKALKIGFAELFTKVILYYFHERVWGIVKWGKLQPQAVVVETEEATAEQEPSLNTIQ